MKCLHMPARIESSEYDLDREYRSARWLYHRLLDFEDTFQDHLDEVSQQCAPGILACGRILGRLGRRKKRRERSSEGTWSPDPRPSLESAVRGKLDALRKIRNADPRWKAALKWADECDDDAPVKGTVRRRMAKPPEKVKRRKDETDEEFAEKFSRMTRDETDEEMAERQAKRRNRLNRREAYRAKLYNEHVAVSKTTPIVYWGTWNALRASVDQARKSVLAQRKKGLPSDWRRPRWDDANTIVADAGGFRVEQGKPWWVVEMRLREGWVRFRAKLGKSARGADELPVGDMRQCKLTRRKNGHAWRYSVSVSARNLPADDTLSTTGMVALDWGHREHGHDTARTGMRVFAWIGDDGESGEILLPRECRELLDSIDVTKSLVDKTFDARKVTLKLPDRNRHAYRKRMMRSGVVDEDAANWLRWETRYERRLQSMRKRIENIRTETYRQAIRKLRRHYSVFAIEDEKSWSHREEAKAEMGPRRKRQNRELSARYEFVQICERLGATMLPVVARNSTRECPEPDCGYIGENSAELLAACPSCGVVRDKDFGASAVIMRRAQEALAKYATEQ